MKRLRFLLFIGVIAANVSYAQTTARWTAQKAWQWYNSQPWLCGFNYIPAYAINYTAMWDKTTFDSSAVDKELSLVSQTGMNVARVVLQHAVYEEDPEYFLRTLNTFLTVCARHGITVMPTLFDDCMFGIEHDPKTGRQPEPLKGWYAWAWSPSPGHSMVIDSTTHPRLEEYVKGVIGRFKNDSRILLWDLYNEPTNGGLGSASFPLLQKTIVWARAVAPSQPLSVGVWNNNKRLNDIALDASDVITFHNYGNKKALRKHITELKAHNRPMLCTEWMNRPAGSTVADNLPVFYEENIACMLWGLVNGKTQTDLPWGHRPGDPEPKVWQHDLYRPDFSPYDASETGIIKKYMSLSKHKK